MKILWGDLAAQKISERIAAPVADVTELESIPALNRVNGMLAINLTDNSRWVFNSSSSASDATKSLVVTPAAGSGRWIRIDPVVDLKLAVAFGTLDAAALFTVPTGFKLRLGRVHWEVTTAFSGGTSSAIGLSSSNAGYATKGDLLGGAGGDVAAGLGTGYKGTVGAKLASSGLVVLVAADTIRFDRIVDAFTAGAGFAHVPIYLIN